MSAETIKIPEPIIEPATIIVESSNPNPLTKPVCLPAAAASAITIPPIRLLLVWSRPNGTSSSCDEAAVVTKLHERPAIIGYKIEEFRLMLDKLETGNCATHCDEK